MEGFIAKMKGPVDAVEKAQIAVGCVTLCIFILMVAYQVISRFTGTVAFFTEEISTTACIWTAFMGSPVMLRRYEHYRFTGVAEKLKGRAFWVNELICLCILLVISVLMTVHGVRLARMFYTWKFSSMSGVSRIWLWLCLPVSGATSLLYVVEAFLKFLHDPATRKIVNEADRLLEETEK